MTECIEEILKTGSVLRERNPLIHCITSPCPGGIDDAVGG